MLVADVEEKQALGVSLLERFIFLGRVNWAGSTSPHMMIDIRVA